MTIAELFVKIGVKGAGDTGKALGGVKNALKSIADTSLEAKAALLAVVYGMEQLMTQSARRGMDLQKFADLTGLSTERLQRWQYAARQSGVDGEDMAASIKGVQGAMADMLTGKGAPAGMGIFAKAVGFDPAKARDTFYVMDKLREFARQAPPDIGNSVLRSFGLSDDTIQFMRKSKIELDKIRPTNVYSSSEIERLSKIHVAWENLWNTLKYFMGHGVANFGMPVVKELASAMDLVMKFTTAIETLIRRFPVLGDVGKVALMALAGAMIIMGGPLTALSAAITGIIFILGELNKDIEGQESVLDKPMFGTEKKGPGFLERWTGIKPPEGMKAAYNESQGGVREAAKTGKIPSGKKGEEGKSFSSIMKDIFFPESNEPNKKKESEATVLNQIVPTGKEDKDNTAAAVPNKIEKLSSFGAVPANSKPVAGESKTQNINIKQDLNFQHPGTNAKQTADSMKKSLQDVARQLPTQGQGT